MSGLIKGAMTGWVGFFFTAIVYMLIQGFTDLVIWLIDVGKDGFAQASTYEWLLLGSKLCISMLVVLRALMNESFGSAKGQPHST